MKLLLVAVACGLTLQTPVRAGELSLNGSPAASLGLPGVPGAQGGEPADLPGRSGEEARVPFLLDGPSVASVDAVHAGENPAGTFGGAGGAVMPDLPLNGVPPLRPTNLLATALPMTAPVDPGVSDSMMYAGLLLLSVAMLWACAGFVSRKPGASVQAHWAEAPRSKRPARVQMMPLKGSR